MPLAYFELTGAVIFSAKGRDVVRYTNARLTNDTKSLKEGEGCLAAALTPQGKTQALFSVYRTGTESYLFTCDGGNAPDVVAAYKRFMVADRVEIEELTNSHALLHCIDISPDIIGVHSLPSRQFSFMNIDSGLLAKKDRGFENGFDLVGPRESVKMIRTGANELSKEEVLFARVSHDIPSFPEEVNETALFSESRLMSAVSFQKGCYAGQEVVERIEALGKTSKVLQLIEFQTVSEDVSPQTPVTASGEVDPVGRVVTFATDPKSGKGFAFVSIKNDPLLAETELTAGKNVGKLLWKN